MVKHKAELKAQIVHEYLITSQSSYDLERKYQIGSSQIRWWVQHYNLNGGDSFKRRREKRKFTADFKLSVVDYYQTHEESTTEVASRFDILPSQVSIWCSKFRQDGIEALKPLPKGRPSKMKRTKKQIRHLSQKNEVKRLKEELAKKNQELYDTRLERDILKKSLTLFGSSKPDKKRK